MRRFWALGTITATLLASACAAGRSTYRVDEPSFHSAGPGAREQIQAVLDTQAGSIVTGDWAGLLAMFIPTERSRCSLDSFTEGSEQSFAGLRERAKGSGLSAKMSGLHVDGFRASVDYQFVLPAFGLTTAAQTSHYLKLGDRWYIDEKAC